MLSLATNGSRSRVLFGFLLLTSCVPPVCSTTYLSLNDTSSDMNNTDRLLSLPNHYFEFGIFPLYYSGTPAYYLGIRYAFSNKQEFTWMANRNTPLSASAVLRYNHGTLQLSDESLSTVIDRNNIWNTFTDKKDIVRAELNDMGNLLLKNKNGTPIWNSFLDSPPTDTLLPGQSMNYSQGHNLTSFQKNGNPTIASDTYTFGWDAKRVLTLSWICPKVFLYWKGGSYIPAPDVYAAHTIQNVERVYFHEALRHLYIDSNPPTAILSGGPDPNSVNVTTLRRITMSSDGGLRILQYTIHLPFNSSEPLQLNESWVALANWVVWDRPDSRSQCVAFGTCGPFSQCVSSFDSLEPATCRCVGSNNNTAEDWFIPNPADPTNGCVPNTNFQKAECVPGSSTYAGNIDSVGMMELHDVDMPWGGDFLIIKGPESANCKAACQMNCYCIGAVYSKDEETCWQKNGNLYNIGYPTVALHGTGRISYLRNQTVGDYKKPKPEKDKKLVEILVPVVATLGASLVALVMFCLCRNETVRQKAQACYKRPPQIFVYQGD